MTGPYYAFNSLKPTKIQLSKLFFISDYGKIAQKFEKFLTRWLSSIYPHEISHSFEEKNQLLKKLGKGGTIHESMENDHNEANDSMGEANGHGNGEGLRSDAEMDEENDGEASQPGVEEFVTKRTSFGRLVKMKVNNDFDYASDQEDSKKKRKKGYYSDEEFKVGEQRVAPRDDVPKVRKRGRPAKISALLEAINSDDSESEPVRSKAKRTRTVADFYSEGDDEDDDESDDGDDEDVDGDENFDWAKKRQKKPKKGPGLNMSLPAEAYSADADKLTFDQYVKLLTGRGVQKLQQQQQADVNINGGQLKSLNIINKKLKAPILNPAITAVLESNKIKIKDLQTQQQQQPKPVEAPKRSSQLISEILSPKSNFLSKQKAINPQAAQLQVKISQMGAGDELKPTSPISLNLDVISKSVKVIGLPGSSQVSPSQPNKKVIVINGNGAAASVPKIVNPASPNVIKIVNLSELNKQQQPAKAVPVKIISSTPVSNTPTIQVENASNLVNGSAVKVEIANGGDVKSSEICNILKAPNNKPIVVLKASPIVNKIKPNITPVTLISKTVNIVNSTTNTNTNTTAVAAQVDGSKGEPSLLSSIFLNEAPKATTSTN